MEEQYVGTKVFGVKATVNSYFTGKAEIRCDYYYYWYDNYGYMHQNNATTYFYISCNAVTTRLSTNYMNLDVGEGAWLEYSLSPSISPTPTVRIYSNNNKVATVNSSGYVSAVGSGDCVITVESNAGPAVTCSVHVNKVDPTEVYLSAPDPIYIGQKVLLVPRIYPDNAQTTFTWKSDSPNIASVDASGYVTGKSEGTACITVNTANGLSDYCYIDVYKPVPSSISLNKSTLRLPVGGTETLTYNVLPSYAIYNVSWESDAPSVVSVSNGRIEAKSPGVANIKVVTDNGKTATCRVTVLPEPTEVKITPNELELIMGRSKTLSYTYEPADAATLSLIWQSSDSKVASVSQQGEVTANAPGHTTITATTRNGIVGKCELTVPIPLYQLFVWTKAGIKTGYLSTDEPQFSIEGDIVHFSTNHMSIDIHRDTLDKFTLEQVLPEHPKAISLPEKKSIAMGDSWQMNIALTPADAQTGLTWFNDAPQVVSVTQDGRVTAKQVGEANLMVQTSNGLRAACRITVPEPRLRFYVWLRNGEVHGYDMEERPEVTLGETVFMLKTERQTIIEYQAEDILRFTLQDAVIEEEIADGVSVPEAMNDVRFHDGALLMAECPAHCPVQIFDTSGRMVLTAETDADGCLSLSLASLRPGIYIIKSQKTTLKIQKR